MDREKTLKFAEQAGYTVMKVTGPLMRGERYEVVVPEGKETARLERFASLVEQATLERAAVACQEFGGIISGDECAELIRALANEQPKDSGATRI